MRREGDKLVLEEYEFGDSDELDFIPVGGTVVFRSWSPKREIEVWGNGELLVRRVLGGAHYCQLWRIRGGEREVLRTVHGEEHCLLCDRWYYITGLRW